MDPVTFLVLIAPLVAFWVFLIRPAKRRQQELTALRAQLQPGAEVVTAAGLLGVIRALDDDVVHLEVADGVVVRVTRSAVAGVVPDAADVGGSEPARGDDAPEG